MGGPATRAIASLGLDANEFFIPLLPTMFAGMACILFIAFVLGLKERVRLGIIVIKEIPQGELALSGVAATHVLEDDLKRPKLRWVNLILTVMVMVDFSNGYHACSSFIFNRFCNCLDDKLSEFGTAKRAYCITRWKCT